MLNTLVVVLRSVTRSVAENAVIRLNSQDMGRPYSVVRRFGRFYVVKGDPQPLEA